MHSQTLRKCALALTFWMALHLSPLKGQTLPLGPFSNPSTGASAGVDASGLLFDIGRYGTGSLSLKGAGARLFFYPGKGAFRAGVLDTASVQSAHLWDDANVGPYSVALGRDTSASGTASFAAGENATASGGSSVALGYATTASGYYAIALGSGSNATGDYAMTTGGYTTASGEFTFAAGVFNLGLNSLGGPANPTAWVPTDPLFEVGDGGDPLKYRPGNPAKTGPSDAFVIYKNGNAALEGNLTANGADNELPNQSIVSANSVLTKGLADSLYLPGAGSGIVVGTPIFGGTSLAINSGLATGSDSFASGLGATAGGSDSVAFGLQNTASGFSSFAVGESTSASSSDSVAMGIGTSATGWGAVAMGHYTTSSFLYTLATGNETEAAGTSAVSMGTTTHALGNNSVAMGETTTNRAYDSLIIGCDNTNLNEDGVSPATPNLWIPTDPIFEIGNGNAYYTPYGYNPSPVASDAFVIFKDGNAHLSGNFTAAQVTSSGTVTAPCMIVTAPGGDIPMYTGP